MLYALVAYCCRGSQAHRVTCMLLQRAYRLCMA
jgi:hypothetical protein